MHLIGRDLNGLRQIEARTRRIGRDGGAALAEHDLFVREAAALGAEDEGDVAFILCSSQATERSAAGRSGLIGGPNSRSYPVSAQAKVTPSSASASEACVREASSTSTELVA